jgi:hypothetical protein
METSPVGAVAVNRAGEVAFADSKAGLLLELSVAETHSPETGLALDRPDGDEFDGLVAVLVDITDPKRAEERGAA